MIYIRIVGGLGNQLFQYALGRHLTQRHNTELVFDLEWFTRGHIPPRPYMLDVFNIAGRKASWYETTGLRQLRGEPGRIGALLRRLPTLLPNITYIKEPGMPFWSAAHEAPDNSYLFGSWQTEKYFNDVESLLHKELVFKNIPSSFFVEVKKKMMSCTSVALHVRRGDLVWNPKVKFGTVSLAYYHTAVEYVASRHPNPTVFVFSDDLPWVKEHLKLPYAMEFVSHPNNAHDYEELLLIASCKHQIIANSSFSWWGAWLNQNQEKIVCAPKQWFADTTKDTRDIVPLEWVWL